MIEVRPLNPVRTIGDSDTVIGRFADSEWWDLIKLARRRGFEPPNIEVHFPRPYDHPVELDQEVSQELWEAISAVYKDGEVPYARTWEESNTTSSFGSIELPGEAPEEGYISREIPHEHPEFHVGKVQVKQIRGCAQIGAEHGGIEIRRVREED